MNLRELQEWQREWSLRNFGEQPAYRGVLGVAEEVGELCHAVLKSEQGIRGRDADDIADAIGDVVIYLCEVATSYGLSLQECVEQAKGQCCERDWRKNPETGTDD